MHREARELREPNLRLRTLVRIIIVHDDLDIEALRHLTLDLLQETPPFNIHVAHFGARDPLTLETIERRKQLSRSMTHKVMRHR